MRNTAISLVILCSLFVSSAAYALTPSDFLIGEQWYLSAIDAYGAWDQTVGSREVIVAVLDTGIDLEHEDLKENLWVNAKEVPDGKDNDNNGYEDDLRGWDFVDGDTDPSPTIEVDSNDAAVSHGTVVAGVIGAVGNNGLGIAGLNWKVRIMPLRVLDEIGSGSSKAVVQAIRYAVDNGAEIINLSFVTRTYDQTLADTLAWAMDQGVVVVTSVGNTAETGVSLNTTPMYPACFDLFYGENRIIAVAATDTHDKKASFSNYGSDCTDLSAPGVDIFGTVFHAQGMPTFSASYGGPWQGTSLSAPMVSGAAALIRSIYPSLTPFQVRLALQLGVDPVKERGTTAERQLGSGRLNMENALLKASQFSPEPVKQTTRVTPHPSHSFVAVQGGGAEPIVRRLDGRGTTLSSFYAFDERFRGGVSVAIGDVTGDGVEEIVVGAGVGGGPQVRIFDLTGKVQSQFFAFDKLDRHGITVATADIDGDGIDEIVVAPQQGMNGQVKIFRSNGTVRGAFYPLQRTSDAIAVTAGNLDDDPEEELLFWNGTQGNNTVLVYNGAGRYEKTLTISDRTLAVADLDGDGTPEIIGATGESEQPLIEIYDISGQLQRSFTPFPLSFHGGVSVAAGDIDQNGKAELYVTPLLGGGPQVRIFNQDGEAIGGFFAFSSSERFGAMSSIW